MTTRLDAIDPIPLTQEAAFAIDIDRHWLECDGPRWWCTCGEWQMGTLGVRRDEMGDHLLPFSRHCAEALLPAVTARVLADVAARLPSAMRKGWGPFWVTGTDDEGDPMEYMNVEAYAAAILAHLGGADTGSSVSRVTESASTSTKRPDV